MVSALGLGTVKLGRNRAVKYPAGEHAPLPSDQQVDELFKAAADVGINLIDTAPAYGLSEQRIGESMNRLGWLGGRQRWIICSKVGESFDPASGESTFDFSPKAIRQSVDRSLMRLGIDALDVLLLHSSGADEPSLVSGEAMDELRRLKAAGKVRAIGASTKTADGGLATVRRSIGAADVAMVTLNPRERKDEVVIDAARFRGVGILVKKALLSGHTDDLRALLPPDLRDEPDLAKAALRFAIRRVGVSSVVVGTSSPERLRDNAEAVRQP